MHKLYNKYNVAVEQSCSLICKQWSKCPTDLKGIETALLHKQHARADQFISSQCLLCGPVFLSIFLQRIFLIHFFSNIESQLILAEMWFWPAAASSVPAARSTPVRPCQRTRWCTVQTALGACRVRSRRSVLHRRLVCVYMSRSFAGSCTDLRNPIGWIVFFFYLLQPQTLQLDFLMKILPNYHHLKKTTKGSGTPVRNWRGRPNPLHMQSKASAHAGTETHTFPSSCTCLRL